jgi:hypothetical protein
VAWLNLLLGTPLGAKDFPKENVDVLPPPIFNVGILGGSVTLIVLSALLSIFAIYSLLLYTIHRVFKGE